MVPPALVSVIIPSYKMGKFIGQALAAVGAQTWTDWEVIVVDDCGPEDGTAEAVAKFEESRPHHRVEFIRHAVNGGVSKARNTAIEAACGEFLAFLDPDDWWEPGYLEKQMDAFKVHPEVGLCYARMMKVNEEGSDIGELVATPGFDAGLPDSLYRRNFIGPSAVVVRRAAVVQVGGFDMEPSIQHMEDWDLWIRLAQAGVVFRKIDALLVKYRVHHGGASNDEAKYRVREDALRRKHGSDPRMLVELISRIRSLEDQLSEVTSAYRGMVAVHEKTFDRRGKRFLNGIFKRS